MRLSRWRIASAFALGALLTGCATWSDSFREIESQLAQENYTQALQALEQHKGPSRDKALYFLNKGMLLRMAGDYRASNEALEAAKELMEQLSATSLLEQGTTFIVNDASAAYAGEEHEQVLVHLYEALNYLALGDPDNARVEALQVDLVLRQQAERISESRYTEDAFARYLTGMIYEDAGEWSDAMIAYRKAYEAYGKYQTLYGVGAPLSLKLALLRLTEHLGLRDELRKYQKEFGIDRWTRLAEWRMQGEVVLVLHNGLAPIKRETSTGVLDPFSGHLVRLSLPYYENSSPGLHSAKLIAADRSAGAEVVEDVQAIARRTLETKMPAITARLLARAVVKGVASKAARDAARKKNDDKNDALAAAIVGIGIEIAGALTERADTRSWATLPHDIQIARLLLPPGTYSVKVELLGAGESALGGFELPEVVVRPGRKTYLSRHWIAPTSTMSRRKP